MEKDIEKKYVITNGSLNPSLTLDELLEKYDTESIITAAEKISLELENLKNNYDLPSYDMIRSSPQKWLARLWKLNDKVSAQVREEAQARDFNRGLDYYKATRLARLEASPEIKFRPYQILGYLENREGFNGFCPKEMQKVISGIEALNIRADYGINNVNTGNEICSWVSRGDYITLMFWLSRCQHKEFLARHEEDIVSLLRSASPDMLTVDAGNSNLSFVMWWD